MRQFDPFALGRSWLLWLLLLTAREGLGAPTISEFMAANGSRPLDEEGDTSDWIEIHNPADVAAPLAGYYLTDDAANLTKWTFPEITLEPGAYLVVFASGKNRSDPATPLHTNFRLSAEGEYLALVAPDGVTVLSALDPAFPPQFKDVSFGLTEAGPPPIWGYFARPTPGMANGITAPAGPTVSILEPNPPQPAGGPLAVEAEVLPFNAPVGGVELYYRRMFGPETKLAMRDDGLDADVTAGDGIWTAVIPAEAFVPSEMTRWRVMASDVAGAHTMAPAFRHPRDSPQYFGTVTQDDQLRTALPVFHWFTRSPSGAGTAQGSRGSVYYDGEFYDNVLFTLHGQSSSGFPKKSYNVDFNRSERFRWSAEAPRVADIDLLTNWADKSKVRHVLAYEVMRKSGVAAHFAFTVRVQQNGRFFSTADLVEDADDIYLKRAGLNPEGALYKVYNNRLNRDAGDTATRGVEKKTRRFENNSDLQALINGLDQTGPALERFLYDNIDIARCVNLLAANSVIRNIDMHSKNWYIYRDTGRSDEWDMLPWDLDLSHGRRWIRQYTYFDNALYTDGYVVTGTAIRLVQHLFNHPAIRAMIMRRIRTLTDRFLQPPPVPGTDENELYYERRLNEQMALIDPPDIVPSDARLDFEMWGSWLQGGTRVPYTNPNPAVETMAEAIQRWKTEYLPGRRRYIYNTQTVDHGGEIPLPQSGGEPRAEFRPLVLTGAPVKVLIPTDGSLGLAWTGNPAQEPFNTAGWTTGVSGVGYERATGYETLIGLDVGAQMRANNSVYIRTAFQVSDPEEIDHLELRMKYDDGFAAFLNGTLIASANAPVALTWNSAATRSQEANRRAFRTFDVTDSLGTLRDGRNVLAIQGLNESLTSSDMIIVPELHAGRTVEPDTREPRIDFGRIEASPASGNQDEEFIELRNPHSIAVDISDWELRGGVEHRFIGGTVLPPHGALYVCPRAAAFRGRASSPTGGEGLFVQGGYQGHLSNRGETLTLVDASGAANNVISFEGQPSEVQRYLVISELMYHPAGDELAEFIELLNVSESVPLDLQGVRFTRGVEFAFDDSAITSLAPGERVLVVRDLDAFEAAYGPGLPVAGVFANGTALSNGGETLKLEDAHNDTVLEFAYSDRPPWPAADGTGSSLVLIAPEAEADPVRPESWRASRRPGGSPGRAESESFEGDPQGDGDRNGERDLLDYVLGNAPGNPPVKAQVTVEFGDAGQPAELRVRYPVRANLQDAEVGISISTDLETWADAAGSLEFVSRQPLDDTRELLIWRVKPPLNSARQVFLRLKASLR